jgi:hypothetical protein
MKSNEFELLCTGGDERLDILENGLNKYFIHPAHFSDTVFRGSCTCNTLNTDSAVEFKSVVNELHKNPLNAPQVEDLRHQIKSAFQSSENPVDFEVFIAPSGTDLVYLPLLFKSIIDPNKRIVNVLTCPEELGSGTVLASQGKYYFSKTQFGETVHKNAKIGLKSEIDLIELPARDENGNIHKHETEIQQIIQNKTDNQTLLVNLVLGSKSGIEDNLSLISKYQKDALFVVDMCQLRVNNELINQTLADGACVMITGSKFFQAPLFCAALLVPKNVINQIQSAQLELKVTENSTIGNSLVGGIADIFAQSDFPPSLSDLRSQLREFYNEGLYCRWKLAIHEIERFNQLDQHQVTQLISVWNSFVSIEIAKNSHFELMKDFDLTNKSIISFRVKFNDGRYLVHEELQYLYQQLLTNNFELLGGNKLQLGQPVRYGDKSFIRLAIGAVNIRKFIKDGMDFHFEHCILETIIQGLKRTQHAKGY